MSIAFSGKWRLQLSLKFPNPEELDELGLGFARFRIANTLAGRDIHIIYVSHDLPAVDLVADGPAWQIHLEDHISGNDWADVPSFSAVTSFDPARGLLRVLSRTDEPANGPNNYDPVLTCTDLSPSYKRPARPRRRMQFVVSALSMPR